MGDRRDHEIRVGRDFPEDRDEEGVEEFEAPMGEAVQQSVGHRLAGPFEADKFSREAEEERGQTRVSKGLAVEELEKGRQTGKVFRHRLAEKCRPGVDRRIDRPPLRR